MGSGPLQRAGPTLGHPFLRQGKPEGGRYDYGVKFSTSMM
jgi:hypothetical protein